MGRSGFTVQSPTAPWPVPKSFIIEYIERIRGELLREEVSLARFARGRSRS